jgi:acyl carrier protein
MTTNNSENSMAGAKEKIRGFVLEYAAGKGLTELKDDEPLLTSNIIDSLGSFRMIAFLEETFPLTIEDTDMVPEYFQTLNDVESFVARKLGKSNGDVEATPELEPEPERELAAVS